MPTISLIASVDKNLGLGFNNQLLCHLPADLKHFKAITLGKPIIMGKKTFESIGKPLPGRLNIVLSHQLEQQTGLSVVSSLAAAIALASSSDTSEIMIIGGAQIFTESLPIADTMYLTHIHHQFSSDVFFPKWDEEQWSCVDSSFRGADENNAFELTFKRYQRIR